METGAEGSLTARDLVPGELAGAGFGDARLSARLVRVGEACASMPERSLPKAFGAKQPLEAAYRFLNNDAVSIGAILQPHQEKTAERVAAAGVALAVWDTTQLAFSGTREGLGRLHGTKDQGFLLHAGLAVSADGQRRPLGILGAHTWVRTGEPRNKRADGIKRSGAEYALEADKESARWADQMLAAHKLVDGSRALIHLADREADAYELLRTLVEGGHRFVIRVRYDRTTLQGEEREKVSAACERSPILVSRQVALSRRVAKPTPNSKTSSPREERPAKLSISSTPVLLRKPYYVHGSDGLALHVVHVREIEPPANTEPVEWSLYTTEPIDTAEQVLDVVDYYRARWLIEELFKALKTGCQFERLQLETCDALTNALGVFLVISWSLLLLRALQRTEPDAPAENVLTDAQISVLQALGRLKSSPRPTVAQALLAVAELGGYIRHKKRPGWLTLARGMQDLLMLEAGWLAREPSGDLRDP